RSTIGWRRGTVGRRRRLPPGGEVVHLLPYRFDASRHEHDEIVRARHCERELHRLVLAGDDMDLIGTLPRARGALSEQPDDVTGRTAASVGAFAEDEFVEDERAEATELTDVLVPSVARRADDADDAGDHRAHGLDRDAERLERRRVVGVVDDRREARHAREIESSGV